jgi:EmrB/QacA subfamily drug resistance transporter
MKLSSNTRLIALIVAGAFFMQNLDSSIIATSLPQMALSFHVQALDLSLGITVYLLSAAAFVPLSGWVADRYGARNIFLLAIVVFTLSSLACGLAASLLQFVIARAVQGLGGALMAPVGRMVVLRNTDKTNLLHATALITWPALAAPVIGPALGGFITTYASWRWNFFLNVPLGMAGVLLVAKFVPNFRDAEPRDMDWRGFFLSAAALVALLYGMESFAHTRTAWQRPLLVTLVGTVLAIGSIRHFHRVTHPLLDLASLKVQTYALSTIDSGFLIRTAISTTPFLLPLLFQLGFGLNAWASGMLILVYFAGNFGIKPVTTPTLRRFGFRSVLIINGALVGLSILAVGFFDAASSRWLLMAVLLAAGITRSMQFTCLNTLAFADVAENQRGSAATLSSMLNQVSSVAGVALGALLLNIAQGLHGHDSLSLADFRFTFVMIGIIGVLSALAFMRLPHNAGAEVSGHRASTA